MYFFVVEKNYDATRFCQLVELGTLDCGYWNSTST